MPLYFEDLEDEPKAAEPGVLFYEDLQDTTPVAGQPGPPTAAPIQEVPPKNLEVAAVPLSGAETTVPPEGDRGFFDDAVAEAMAQLHQLSAGVGSIIREPLKIGRLARPSAEQGLKNYEEIFGEPAPGWMEAVGERASAYGDAMAAVGNKLAEWGVLPEPDVPTSTGQELAGIVGQAGAFMATGFLGATAKLATWITPTVMGALQSMGASVEETQKMGATPEEQAIAAAANAALGATEGVSGAFFLNKLNKATGGRLWETLKKIPLDQGPGPIRSAIEGFLVEGGQEWIQQYGSNVVASDIAGYDPERAHDEGVWHAATLGGVVGAMFGGGFGEIARRERKEREEELEQARDNLLNSSDPINAIIGPFSPLEGRLEMQETMQELEAFITQRREEAKAAQAAGTEVQLPKTFVKPTEATTIPPMTPITALGPELGQAVDRTKHADPAVRTVKEALENTDERVVVAGGVPSSIISNIQTEMKKNEKAIAEYDKKRKLGKLPEKMSTAEKAERADYAYHKSELARWQKHDETKQKVLRKISDYVENYLKVFDQAIPGAGQTRMVIMPRTASKHAQSAHGFIIPTEGMATAKGKQDVNFFMFDLDRVLDMSSPDSAAAAAPSLNLDLYETVNHELGHWLSFRYRQMAAQDPKTAEEYYAIQQDYAQWMLDNLKTPMGKFLYMQRGLKTAAQMHKSEAEAEAQGYRGAGLKVPVEKAWEPLTVDARAKRQQGGRDYFYNFAEYLAHRLERLSARPSAEGPITEMAEMVDPGIFKKFLEMYKQVHGASDIMGVDPRTHTFDQFVRRLSLRNRLAEDAVAKMKKSPANLSQALKGKIPGFNPDYWGGFQEHMDKFTRNMEVFQNLLQWAWQNPHVAGLQSYTDIVANRWSAYTRQVYARATHTLMGWRRLGKESSNRVTNILMEEAEQEERYTPQEIQKRLTDAEAEVYYTIRQDLNMILEEMRTLSLKEAQRTILGNEEMLKTELDSINDIFNTMKSKGYFPFLRFGKYVVSVRAADDLNYEGKLYRKGQVVSWEAFDHDWEQNHAARDWAQRGGKDFLVGKTLMNDQKFATQAMPLPMLKMLRDKVPPSAQPAIEEAIKSALPAGSFKRRFLRKRGIKGFSQDFQRSYASYMRMAAGHISRVKHAEEMLYSIKSVGEDAKNMTMMGLDAVQRERMYQALQKHYDYIMNPGNELQALRSAGFFWYLGFNVKSAFLNLLQVPQVGMPYLAGRFGDVKAVTQLARAMKDVPDYWLRRDDWLASAKQGFERRLTYAIRRGPISPGGAYFSTDGSSTYFDEDPGLRVETGDMTAISGAPKFYDLSKLKILDTNEVEKSLEYLEHCLNTMKAEVVPDKDRIAELEAYIADMKTHGYGPIDYITFENLSLGDYLQSAGYEGISILESDDNGEASSVFVQNTKKVQEISHAQFKKRKEAPPSERKGEIVKMIQQGQTEGWLDQSLAMELSIASSESRADRLAPINKAELLWYKASEYGALPFHVAEKTNRQVMAMAAYNLARDQGYSERKSVAEARLAVQKSMYEHASWNRPLFMRGKKSVFFLFMNYVQNTAYFATRGDGTALRYWLMLGMMAGVMGLPGAEDLEDLIDFVVTNVNKEILGSKNPKFQLRQEMRETAEAMNINPDLLLHGFAQNSFGLPALAQLTGLPNLPSFDLSRSIGLGNIIPGTGAPEAFQEGGFDAAVSRTVGEMGGAAVGATEDFLRAMMSDDPNVWKRTEAMLPTFAKNVSKAARTWNEGAVKTASGEIVAPFDPFEPKDQMELIGQGLGFQPSRVPRGWERYMAEKELVNYYALQQSKVMKQFYHAVYTEDREGIVDAREGVAGYNKIVPFPEMQITADMLKDGTTRYITSQKKNEKGVSGRKTYRLEQSVKEHYPEPAAPSTEGTSPGG